MLAEIGNEVDLFVAHSRNNIGFWLGCIAILWLFNILNWMTGSKMSKWGIVPRKPYGLRGIFFAPFLHGNFNHLFFNSIPLAILGLFILADGRINFLFATLIMMVCSGLAVWFMGRPGNHIGASAVIAGYFGYVLASAYESPSFTTIALGVVALYYFGGILFSVLPTSERTSWEGHLTGLLSGILAKYILPYVIYYL